MHRRWLVLTAALFAGCARTAIVEVEHEQPRQVSTDFGRLASVLEDIRKSEGAELYEGLPSEFWEPRLLERELDRKKAIRLQGYLFYDERLAFRGADAEHLTAMLSAKGTFKRYRGQKACGGFHPDYCVA